MIEDNAFLRNKELTQARLNTEKKKLESRSIEINQAKLGRIKFQDIADERYDANINQLNNCQFDTKLMLENSKMNQRILNTRKENSFYKK